MEGVEVEPPGTQPENASKKSSRGQHHPPRGVPLAGKGQIESRPEKCNQEHGQEELFIAPQGQEKNLKSDEGREVRPTGEESGAGDRKKTAAQKHGDEREGEHEFCAQATGFHFGAPRGFSKCKDAKPAAQFCGEYCEIRSALR